MENLQEHLQILGLSQKEATFYINALQLGQFSILEISRKSGIKRPTCYLIVDDLIKKGLISIVPNVKKISYLAESPDILIKKAEDNINNAKKLAPELFAIFNTSKIHPSVKFYPGQKGIQNAYNDVLCYPIKECKYITDPKELVSAAGKEFMDKWIEKRIKKGIKALSVRVNISNPMDDVLIETKNSLREIKYAPKDIRLPYTILIYDKKVCVMSSKKDSFAFIVESEDFKLTMDGLFSALWQISTSIEELINKNSKLS